MTGSPAKSLLDGQGSSCYPFGRSLAIEPLEDRRLLSGVTLTPSATLTGLDDPQALAFDSSGNLYIRETTKVLR